MQRRMFLAAGAVGLVAGVHNLCRADGLCARTDSDIEGPFFLPGAPERTRLAEDGEGRLLTLGGVVQDSHCRPCADAVLEIWQANPAGEYDRRGFSYRGQLRTDAEGRYGLQTVFPGRYRVGASYRPAHIHVKVHANGHAALTTQLYFPADPFNDADPWFDERRAIRFLPSGCTPGPAQARFNFTV